ncbi:FG-GAP and VCBS repeat-containing protein [Streptomyces sp. NPDC086023]|uniref:FG-GAP and VCBS repeat-containing protein n=1 Tax=Streptomyces sp. NPDC086023 TaxID=3365746 RepID=UPI0037D43529
MTSASSALKGAGVDSADFNGDGFSDLAISATYAVINGSERAGAIGVLYGSAAGMGKQNSALITEASPGVPGTPGYGHDWGAIQGHGDLDGDGFDDLLVSGRRLAEKYQYLVLWGGKAGLSGGTLVPAGVPSTTVSRLTPERASVADVNGDGIADIAGKGYLGIGAQTGTGLRTMLGPFSRTTGKPTTTKYRATGVLDRLLAVHPAVGDITDDGRADVVTQVADANYRITNIVYKGTSTGAFVKANSLSPDWGKPGYWKNAAFGDINGDGYRDFVAGSIPGSGDNLIGRIHVAYGGPEGFSTTIPARTYRQSTAGVPGTNDRADEWGVAVAMGDTDGDGYADIVIGAPREAAADGTRWTGAVTVLRGSAGGVTTTGAKLITQNTSGVPTASEEFDLFGTAVSAIDSDNDGHSEVYVGGPGQDKFGGRVWKLPSGSSGVTGTGATSFRPTDFAGFGSPIGETKFGAVLTR